MKRIKYEYLLWEQNNGTEEAPDIKQHFITKDFLYSDGSFEAAQREAWNDEYEIYDDGQPDPADIPTFEDRMEAQLTYTAIMTGTLLEV
jgi:hypothetical protein